MLIVLRITSNILFFSFFFNDTATTEIYTLSLHDALPISRVGTMIGSGWAPVFWIFIFLAALFLISVIAQFLRSEEHTSELQSRQYLVCRLLLEKKKYYVY